jgi:hypothetical protein
MVLGANTGPEGWTHITVPNTDAVVPVETIDFMITWPIGPVWDLQPYYGGSPAAIAGY